MKYLFSIILLLSSIMSFAQTEQHQLILHSFKESRSESNMDNVGALFRDFPKDKDGIDYCAWIRVKFENMPLADAEKVEFKVSSSSSIQKVENRLKEEENEIWLFVSSTSSTYIEAVLQEKNIASNRLSDIKLVPKGVYDMVLRNDKTVSIVVITNPENAIATIETGQKVNKFGNITGVTLGKHILTITLNGKKMLSEEIEVTEDITKFGPYDLREKKKVKFTSDPSGAILYINGKERGKTPIELTLPYDSYKVEARHSLTEVDSRSITVDKISDNEIKLEPIKKKTFEVFATYNGQKVSADLYVDGKKEENTQISYTLTKPVGKTYDMRMIYYGDSKKRKIRVTSDMDVEQEFKISARNSFVWPWQRRYDHAPVGFSAGYVSKQLITEGEGAKLKENGIWDDGEGKSLHGMQMGFHFQPCFSFGLGLYTGLFYELYMSFNDDYSYNEFMEHCVYLPLHAYFRIPFAKKVALAIHGGVGLNCSVYGAYTDSEDYYESYTDFYGEDFYAKRFNLTADIGVALRFSCIQINAQYSKGLNDHKSYSNYGDFTTHQNKLSVSLSYVFSGN